ncbi:fatty acid desaturase [Chromobacterium subtsugae]|mgnify:CR=1 FL=1|uniref:Fatty acid desaturase n=1 Tax=Chromobacterium subtsugae TaxID=251747 RepID=A0ABS7FCF2_9NEIS|nr:MULTISPECIES: fatty acid desaturase [Chromobacterium]MBW7566490.1 fatty acid desaturase [Chromobacterium subtsugae]MBW8287651.1 fatty acid desaturase [Chromobacterium subtsugae]WSE90983.1 fatty acid desaturase [Chromobacterium subtsugae]WVH59357.1 fatty acid desaturase [Chromobacterium subtsugae]
MSTTNTTAYDLLAGDLEGSTDVQLAPVKGQDLRRNLPREYFVKRPALFTAKILFAFALIALGWYGVWYALTTPVTTVSILAAVGGFFLNGLIYAHLIELQHECLHCHAFKSVKLNRLFGALAGVFMFSSHSHYRYDHLRHHAYLGTERNLEHFDYRFNDLNSLTGFAIAFFDLNRYKRVFNILAAALTGKPIAGVAKEEAQRHIKQEYLIYALAFVASVIASLHFHTWLFALAWWLPTLIIAEGAHFMIEMPEHYGLNTQTAPDVLENTRTIRTNPIIAWYVNGNHTHTAHHFHQGVPMCNVKKLNALIKPQLQVVETSYFAFYCDVIRGRISHRYDATCMAR